MTELELVRARALWASGKTLGEIAAALGCDVKSISWPLFMDSYAQTESGLDLP